VAKIMFDGSTHIGIGGVNHSPQVEELKFQKTAWGGIQVYESTDAYKKAGETVLDLIHLAFNYPNVSKHDRVNKYITLADRKKLGIPTTVGKNLHQYLQSIKLNIIIPKKEDFTVFHIPKRRGGKRRIEAPDDKLKQMQSDSINKLKYKLFVTPFAHAFCSDRDIVTMATPHVKQDYVICIDISDFFPSTTYARICLEILAMKRMSIQQKLDMMLEAVIHFVDFGDGKGYRLPQGSPGSPVLSNVALNTFDWTLSKIAYNMKWEYSRYADDVVISGVKVANGYALKYKMEEELSKRGYTVNKKKTKVKSNKQRQMVCGLIVNEKINIPRKWRKRLRAEKFQQKQNKGFRRDTVGRESFVNMVYNNNKVSCSSIEYYEGQKAFKLLNK
jgi:retron-type reverse transcriptase